jgi:hypothetical protein
VVWAALAAVALEVDPAVVAEVPGALVAAVAEPAVLAEVAAVEPAVRVEVAGVVQEVLAVVAAEEEVVHWRRFPTG